MTKLRFIALSCFLALGFLTQFSWAQTNHLNTKITINVSKTSVEEVLMIISKEGGFNFSYNADILRADSIVSFNVRNKPVEKVLNELFKNTLRYKVVNDHIILLLNIQISKEQKQTQKSMNTSGYTLTGYVLDAHTGQTLPNATIYEIDGRISAITNSQGFYMMVLPSDRTFKGLNYCRYDYLDSIVFLRPEGSMQFDVSLKPRQTEIQKIQTKTTVLEHDLESRQLVTWLVPEEAMLTAKNITTHERTAMQVSLLPFIGSDYRLSGTKTNNISLNILAGYTGSVDGVELGSLVNIVQNDVKGAQLAGFGNVVGKDTRGAQLAGFFNLNNGSVTGAQIAGFQNTLNGEMHGAQVSGFNNITTQNVDGVQATGFVNVAFKDVNMAQLSGFVNFGRNIGGLQATGFVNIAYGDVNAAQLAGFVNLSKNVNGVQAAGFVNLAHGNIGMAQMAGFVNYCDSVTGAQLAGFVNVARLNVTAAQVAGFVNYGTSVTGAQIAGFTNLCLFENKGAQISGLFNYATTLNGVQLAMINISDTVESGLPIGFFSFVRRGYHVIELSADEVFYFNATFKTGVKRFYNIFGFSRGDMNIASQTYGVGFDQALKQNHSINFDLTVSSVLDSENDIEIIGGITKFKPTYSYSFHKHFTVFAAPSLNIYWSQSESGNSKSIAFHPFWDQTYGDMQIQAWVGVSIGARM